MNYKIHQTPGSLNSKLTYSHLYRALPKLLGLLSDFSGALGFGQDESGTTLVPTLFITRRQTSAVWASIGRKL